jgi:hypothetical protein
MRLVRGDRVQLNGRIYTVLQVVVEARRIDLIYPRDPIDHQGLWDVRSVPVSMFVDSGDPNVGAELLLTTEMADRG